MKLLTKSHICFLIVLIGVLLTGDTSETLKAEPVGTLTDDTGIYVERLVGNGAGYSESLFRVDSEWAADLPFAARRTIANADWLFRYIEVFALIERRHPTSFDELRQSPYMPTGSALINPYTGVSIGAVSDPTLGDFSWTAETYRDESGNEYEQLKVRFYYDPGGDPQDIEVYEVSHNTASLVPADQDEERARTIRWLQDLSDTEKRLYWICHILEAELEWTAERFAGGKPLRTFAGYARYGWRIPKSVMPNLWENRTMQAVPVSQPRPGDFSYGWWPDDNGEPAIVNLKCYGEGGRVVYSDLEPVLQESFALERELGLPGDFRVFPDP
ncbi:MAG: hypothetical protein V2G42_08665 [bacterium JZ-2024 1]